METILTAFIIGILIFLFILSLVIDSPILGALSGTGMIIFSFTFIAIYFWLFLILMFTGLTMTAVSIFN